MKYRMYISQTKLNHLKREDGFNPWIYFFGRKEPSPVCHIPVDIELTIHSPMKLVFDDGNTTPQTTTKG